MLKKGIITENGHLKIKRGGEMTWQYCRWKNSEGINASDARCGDWCPAFRDEPNCILICGGDVLIFDELLDKRDCVEQ